jgi:tetratricopeptide (TPR) repeat protein
MKRFLIFLFFSPIIIPASAQTSARNDELKFDADYYLMRQEFNKALDLYLQVLRTEPDNADTKHRIGICYLNSEDEKAKAVPYLEEAVQKISTRYNVKSFKETNAPIEAYFLLGSAYRVNNQLKEAIQAYEKYKEYLDPKDDYNREATDQYIKNCQTAQDMLLKPKDVHFTNLGKVINNSQANFNAVPSGDGKNLVFTSPGRQGYDIYQSALTDSGWTEPRNITSMLGTGRYMKTCYLSQDGTLLLLVQEDPEDANIFFSQYKKGRWAKAEPVKKPVNSSWNETHASMSPDGKIMYFTSNRKGGEGDLDIYRSMLQGDSWSSPQNLGPEINTPYNEETPFVSGDGNVLYFSSEGHQGMGGYDIFRVDFAKPEKGAVNMGYPINTTDNNLFYVPGGNDTSAFYAFSGPDTYGGRDIYQIAVIPEQVEQQETLDVALEPPVQLSDTTPERPEGVPVVVAEVPLVVAEVPLVVAEVPIVADEESVVVTEQKDADTVILTEEVKPRHEVTVEVPVQKEPENEIEESAKVVEKVDKARSYTVQFMALRNPADLQYFTGLTDIAVTYCQDAWYRYTWITTTDSVKAVRIQEELVNKGYTDAFIRRKSIVPQYTIQVMAVPGPVTDLTRFRNLPEISAMKGSDKFCRYTTGDFESKDEALTVLEQVKSLGYQRAFVRRVRILQ